VIEQAKQAAAGTDVSLGGGADAVQQYLAAGLLDELLISVVPVFLGGGGPALRQSGRRASEFREPCARRDDSLAGTIEISRAHRLAPAQANVFRGKGEPK
jgi:dihydrofolate reductase